MGLNTTHGAWDGPYSSFNNFRRWLSKIEGFDLDNMEGFGGEHKPWDEIHSDLKPLLDHSDCDGEISWQDCKKIADILKIIINENVLDSEQWLINKAEDFRIGALLAYENKENIEFH
jgi:hypothetical protein